MSNYTVIAEDSDLLNLEIRESTIPNAGMGVFANKKITPGQIIAEYRGTVITGETAGTDTTRDLLITATDDQSVLVMRGNDCVATYVNDCIAFRKYTAAETKLFLRTGELARHEINGKKCLYNCSYVLWQDKMWVVATVDIAAGEELFVPYGRGYWALKLWEAGYFTLEGAGETDISSKSIKKNARGKKSKGTA